MVAASESIGGFISGEIIGKKASSSINNHGERK
jgi:hypothetical protein